MHLSMFPPTSVAALGILERITRNSSGRGFRMVTDRVLAVNPTPDVVPTLVVRALAQRWVPLMSQLEVPL